MAVMADPTSGAARSAHCGDPASCTVHWLRHKFPQFDFRNVGKNLDLSGAYVVVPHDHPVSAVFEALEPTAEIASIYRLEVDKVRQVIDAIEMMHV